MADIQRATLFGKLNSVAYKAMESATVFCKMRGNSYVELAHWFHQMLDQQDSDVWRILKHFEVNASRLATDLVVYLDKLPRGASSISDLSEHIGTTLERSWVYSTLMYKDSKIRTGHVLIACLKTPSLKNVVTGISSQFDTIKIDTLMDEFDAIVKGSPEDDESAVDGSGISGVPGEASGAMSPAEMGKQEALAKYAVDLTQRARDGAIDPIVGRDEEIRQIVDILMRRRQNNPILTGEAGVGKTAVVEGFALRIARGDVPPSIRNVKLMTLDIGLLQAGASMKGEFENRLKKVIEEVQASETPIILFIDEAHTLIGAGGQAGTGDAANLLKPALARGDLRTIAATTWSEYKKHIEKDPALTRRFQVVQIDEPDETKAILMMRGMASTLEKHHQVQVLDEGIEASVRLSHRYIPGRQLPDKSVSLLDTAAARVAISQHAVPAEVDNVRKQIDALNTELEIIGREKAIGMEVSVRETTANEARIEAQAELEKLDARWAEEKELVAKVLELRAKLRGDSHPVEGTGSELEEETTPVEALAELTEAEREAALTELKDLQSKLAEFQGENPLILPSVDADAVASVVADWTGIPVGRMVKDEVQAVLELADSLAQRVIGQDHAMEMIAKRIQTSRASLDNPNKPIGVFMLAGTSGVGKTETALALAEALYGGEDNVITINMSEFQESHTVSTLKGSPPGYVGYGEGGILTEAVRRKPYSVVLLDEVEKAHSDVHEIFFQVFDKGRMEDSEGQMIDFKNTIILLTSNAGTELITDMCKDPELMPTPEGLADAVRAPLLKVFPPALLGRLVTIPYFPLSDHMIREISKLQLGRLEKRIGLNHGVPFTYDEAVLDNIVERCTERESGGRMIDNILTNTLLPALSAEFLNRMLEGQEIGSVHVSVDEGEFTYRFG
jgi:type VI secretion system protein VasG